MHGIVGATAGEIVYDSQDRLTKYGDYTFEYTLKGDLWRRTVGGATTTYDFDALGALRTVRLPNGNVIEYQVDGRGRRVGKRVNGLLVKQWVYGHGLGPLAELDGAGVVKMRFVYASRSNVPDLVKMDDGKVYRLYADHLGSPRILYDVAASAVVKQYSFDEFGNREGTLGGPFEIPFGFAGGLFDPDTELTRFGAREYDARIGRWVSKDPILFGGGQSNLYVYVANDPINVTDVTGLLAGVPDWLEDLDNKGYLQAAGDFSAGVAAGATFGLSDHLIRATGLDAYGDLCSTAHTAGTVSTIAIGAYKAFYQVPKVVYHFTSAARAASIAKDGAIFAGPGLYGTGVYATRWNIAWLARIQGAASTEAVIAIETQGGGWTATLFPGTFRTIGTSILQ